MSELLTANELAQRLGIRPATVREWARSGRIPEIKLSTKVRRFDIDEVLAAVKDQKGKAVAQ